MARVYHARPMRQMSVWRVKEAVRFARKRFLASFGLDQSGNLYIVDLDGEIFRIEAG